MFDAATLEHVARLARLPLTEREREEFGREIAAILHEFESLPDAPGAVLDAAPPPLRDDAAHPADPEEVETIVCAFPHRDGRLASVPRGL